MHLWRKCTRVSRFGTSQLGRRWSSIPSWRKILIRQFFNCCKTMNLRPLEKTLRTLANNRNSISKEYIPTKKCNTLKGWKYQHQKNTKHTNNSCSDLCLVEELKNIRVLSTCKNASGDKSNCSQENECAILCFYSCTIRIMNFFCFGTKFHDCFLSTFPVNDHKNVMLKKNN